MWVPNLRICNCFRTLAFAIAPTLLAATAFAADLTVNVSGIAESKGEIGCALFKGGDGFPMDNSVARQIWLPADAKGVTCRFDNVSEGQYAVSVSHDLNGNRKVDTNFVGMPKEAWGVSNNARPTLRPPRFDEAAFKMPPDQELTLSIKVAR